MFGSLFSKTCLILAFLSSASAQAVGSLALEELLPVMGQSPRLAQELARVLASTDEKVEAIVCVGVRLGRQYGPVSAYRVSPYTCWFGQNTELSLVTQTRWFNSKGQALSLEEVAPLPSETPLYRTESLVSWKWK